MVGRHAAALLVLVWAGGAHAQAADWARAGGSLFAEPLPALDANAFAPTPARPDRVADLDQPLADAVATAAGRHGLDPKLLHALIVVESAYGAKAVSRAGAAGLTQLMPATAAELGVRDRFDIPANLAGGAAYLARQVIRFGDLRLALAAYNAGPTRVAAAHGAIPVPETRAYVTSVINCYLALGAGRPVRRAADCAPPGAPP